ncbi:MAG TPA: PPOX class F420-dependent oxidoreductase [Thermodesulfobacteriota bacterium]|nr:PPOX class F420-dependent oxidoreductase [Thermodesulfobacteriota bacterium]
MAKLPEQALKLIKEGKNFATIATLMPDGSPHATVTWIDTDGKHVIFNTAEGRLKPKNLRKDPRVSISILNSDNPYQQVVIQGRAVEMTHDGADEHIDRMAKKYLGVDKYPYRAPGEKRVIVKVAPDKVSVMG